MLGFQSEVLGLVADSVHTILRSLSATKPVEPQMENLVIVERTDDCLHCYWNWMAKVGNSRHADSHQNWPFCQTT